MVVDSESSIEGKRVTLKKSGKRLEVVREDDHGGEWVILDAKPNSIAERENKGVRIIAFTAPAGENVKLRVRFRKP